MSQNPQLPSRINWIGLCVLGQSIKLFQAVEATLRSGFLFCLVSALGREQPFKDQQIVCLFLHSWRPTDLGADANPDKLRL